ncbi:hypothetical protein [Microbacterium album]|uniref:Uncharacterized protein n=1 Tax=Microbacterium album TaxID=2053191 RepID=A0A917IG15_9MICO|nr:hypothetical protein [Microbacterium album]GGH40172.1 hypothetical protein GCM10010921_11900 [Microbacterium album]
MLRAIDPEDAPPPAPYHVPWHADRRDPAHPLLSNDSAEPLQYVRAYIADETGAPDMESWGHLSPGETRELCLCGCDLDDTTITLAWFRPDDPREYLWSFVL